MKYLMYGFFISGLICFLVALFVWCNQAEADEIFFSPGGGCEKAISGLIDGARSRLQIAVYSINNKEIVNSIFKAKQRKIKIQILTDHVQAASNKAVTLSLAKSGIPFRLHSVNRIMHNKFIVVDGEKAETGSFNWTEPAQNSNAENCVLLSDPKDADIYSKQFDVLWQENTQNKSDEHLTKIKAKAK